MAQPERVGQAAELSEASRVAVQPTPVAAIAAAVTHVEPPTKRDLLLQALLHLPRIARGDGTVDWRRAISEIEQLAASRTAELMPLRSVAAPPTPSPSLDELEVRRLDNEDAKPILAHFHYLRSFRADSITLGAMHRGRTAAVCSISPLDLADIAAKLPIPPQEVAVVSRVFAFDWAPRNVVSFLLARAESMARRDGTRILLTYLNPNMGFSGVSYRAANWVPLGHEVGTRYAYLDGRYITDRALAAVPAAEQARVEYSQMRLKPLTLLCRLVDRSLRRLHPEGFHLVLERHDHRARTSLNAGRRPAAA